VDSYVRVCENRRIAASSLLRRPDKGGHDYPVSETTINREAALQFQRLMLEECGVDLTLEQAWARAIQMVGLYRMLLGPIPEDAEVLTSTRMPLGTVDDAGMLE